MLRTAIQRSMRYARPPLPARPNAQLHRLSHVRAAPVAASQQPLRMSPLVSQAMLLDQFGKQHHYYDLPIRDHSLAYWKTALVASGVCIASSLSDDGAVRAASSQSGGSGKSGDGDKMFEELKQKLAELTSESLAALHNLVPDEYKDLHKQLDDFLESGKGGQLSWGFAIGVCSGFALKKVSKVGALALGALFVLMQCASYSGYIDVNYKKLERDVMDLLDINKDGQFDAKDVDAVYKQVMKVLEFSLPAGSGYAVGFLVGFRAG